jgi:hypothetical protein
MKGWNIKQIMFHIIRCSLKQEGSRGETICLVISVGYLIGQGQGNRSKIQRQDDYLDQSAH